MEILRLMLILLSLLPGALPEEWSIRALPRRAVSRSCVVIPCTFDFPSHPYTALHGAWFKYWYSWKYTVSYTKDPKYGMSTFVGRAKIVGDLEQKNCSLRINNLRPEDSDMYYFYVDLEGFKDHTFTDPVQLQVVHVPDRPDVLLQEDITEGSPAILICKAFYACPDNRPILTWSELPESTVNTITKNSGEVSTVLTFIPSFKHHRLTVLCTSEYPETSHRLVNSVTLSVKYFPRNTLILMIFKKGNMIFLRCSSEGNPAVHNFSWSKVSNGKDTDLSQVGETITVPRGIGEEIYYCTATSTLGSSRSPPIRIPTKYDAFILSESRCTQYLTNVTCLCVVESNSSVEVMWRLPGMTIGVTGSGGVYETQSTRAGSLVTNTLTINGSNLTMETINCSVANSRGRAPSQMQLEIQAVLSQEWKGGSPRDVTAQEGLCAQILCHYSYPSRLANETRRGVWFNNEKWRSSSIAFHSKDHNHESPRLRNRTQLSGDLIDGDCSLIISDITQQDAGPYFFRIEFDNGESHNYYPATQLHVSAVLSQEWKGGSPRDVTAQEGLCAEIPCHYSYPSCLANQPRGGVWFNTENETPWAPLAFHSKDHNHESPRLRHRTRLSGDLIDGDCSLIINDITQQDAGAYFFRIEFDNGKSHNYYPATQLHVSAVLSQEWKGGSPWDVTAQEGLCAEIPCHYSYPSCLANQPRGGVWFNTENETPWAPLAFHSKDHNHESPRLRHRTRLSGDLIDGDCSLIINDITQQDAGAYFFRIEFDNGKSHNYYPAIQLHVSDFTDKPTIFPAEIIAEKRVDVSCIFNTTCNGTAPVLSWVNPADIPGSVSNSVTQHGITRTYTSVLTLIPSLKHHGQTLICRVRYPSVTSERTLVLTVQYAPRNLSITSRDTIKDSSTNIKEGNSAAILCSVESFPASNLTWRHLGVTMNRTSSNKELWLEFPHVTSRVTGDYQCVAENEHGAVESTITITVEHPPKDTTVAISGAMGAIREGSNITLTCSSKSVPPASSYTWFRIDGNMNAQLNISARSIQFGHVTREDDASFYCTAGNPLGNGTSTTVHLSVEYKPEISPESGCTQRAEAITCVCAARSNPPGDLTWHLPLANISGNQSSGHFMVWRISAGQLVTGSLTLLGHQGEEEAAIFCSVRNRHGEAMFKVYLWVKGSDCNERKVGLLAAAFMLIAGLVGFIIFKYVQKRNAATEETALELSDIAMSYSPLAAKHQGAKNMVNVEAWNTTSDAISEAETPTPQDLSEGPAEEGAHHGHPAKHEDLLHANVNFLKLPSSDGMVHRSEDTEYAQIRFQQN